MTRAAALVLVAACACAALACGKYGSPVRARDRQQAPVSEEKSEEAKP